MLNLEQTWVKAAVEHRILEIQYYSGRTKEELTVRQIEPDFVGMGRDERNSGLWATFCHLRHEGPRCFKPDSILRYKALEKTFAPSVHGRWKELVASYERLGLSSKQF